MTSDHIEISGGLARPTASELARRQDVAAHEDGTSASEEFYRRLDLDSAGAEALELLMDENGLDRALALSVFGSVMDNPHLFSRQQTSDSPQVGDSSKWRAVAAAAVKVLYYLTDDRKRKGGTNPAVTQYAALHVWDLPEFDAVNGNLNMQQFADTVVVRFEVRKGAGGRMVRTPVYLTKQAVNNAVKDAQKHFQLPPRRDQRRDGACANMRDARKKQLKQ